MKKDNRVKETIIAACLYYGDCPIGKAMEIADKLLSIFPELKKTKLIGQGARLAELPKAIPSMLNGESKLTSPAK